MSRLPYILLLSVFLFNVSGYYFVHLHRVQENRKEMKALAFKSIPEGQLEKISLPAASAGHYEIGNNEIRVKGEYYDIVKKEKTGNMIVYHCINDKTEKKLESDLRKHISEHVANTSPEGKDKNDSSKNLGKDYFPSGLSSFILPSFHASAFPSFHPYLLPSFPLSPSSPPPEFSLLFC